MPLKREEELSVSFAEQTHLGFDVEKQFTICLKFLMFLLVIKSYVKFDDKDLQEIKN